MSQAAGLTRERWSEIEAILDEVLELAPAERGGRLDGLCGADRGLRAEVEALLAADSTAEGDFLRVPAAAAAAELFEAPAPEMVHGRQLGPYRLLRQIGAGGMGKVYEAHDERLSRSVAIKVLNAELSRGSLAKERFLREARAASRLDHRNIITVHDLGETAEGELYLVTAFYDGETLSQRLARGPLPFDEARAVTLAVARALAHAHEAGVLHRDIKPANIMLVKGGEAKVLDFGIARILGEAGPTQTGHAPGTPAYMSPEQARGLPLDERADLWALGATLYEMLAGRRAFPGDDPQAVLYGILNRDPEPLAELRPEVPPELARLTARLLAKPVAERPLKAGDLVAELAAPEEPGRSAEVALGAGPAPGPPTGIAARPAPLLRVLVVAELACGEGQARTLGDEGAFTLAARHDRAARDLVARFGGQEVDKGERFLVLFERAADAVGFGLAYQGAVARLGQGEGGELAARVGIHLGEVFLRRNPEADIARGAKPLEVEGVAKSLAARVVALAGPRQTLLTRAVFDLARRAALAGELVDAELSWLAHGAYAFAGDGEPVEIFEVGVRGFAPLTEPPPAGTARRIAALGDELALGWRPAAGQPVPRRPNWTLSERIGEGGFGEVWLAAHKSGEKRVFKFCFEAARLRALKREVTLFRLLRDALGHRHDIARILDWSFEQPPFFLEAEYTEGGNLAEWAASQGGLAAIPLALRLALAAEVGEALAAAHSVGILHKDVKPENVLVAADRDGTPRARLTDFGIGLLDPGATVVPSFTALGFTATASPTEEPAGGTVRYMAPELLEGKPASIQADIYSLGVVIYQLVAGDFARTLAPGWQRDVPDELLAEDLATFLDGRPERRPASALAVAESLRSLEARRAARAAERRAAEEAAATRAALERHERRRKVATVVAAAAVVVLAVVGMLAVREQRARQTATLRQQQAESLIGYMLGDLRDKLEPVGRLEILDSVGEKAMEYFAAVPLSELSDDELARRSQALYQIGDVRMRQGKLAEAIAPFEESLALAKELVARDPESPERLFDLAQSHFWLGSAHLERGELDEAKTQFLSYFEIASRSTERDPDDRTWQMELAYAHTNLAAVAEAAGSLADAATEIAQSLAIKERLAAEKPGDLELERSLAGGHSWLARIRARQGDLKGGLAEYRREKKRREGLALREPGNAEARALLATCLSHVADLAWQLGSSAEALEELARMRRLLLELTELDPANTAWKRDLAVCHRQSGEVLATLPRLDEAKRELAAAERLFAELGADGSPSFDWQREAAWTKLAAAVVATELRDAGAARRGLAASLAALATLHAKRPEDARTASLLAQALLLRARSAAAAGDGAGAQRDWQQALAALEPAARASADPLLLAPWVELLTLLNRGPEAAAAKSRLAASGSVHPMLAPLSID